MTFYVKNSQNECLVFLYNKSFLCAQGLNMPNYEKLIIFFDKLTKNANVKNVIWRIDEPHITTVINHETLAANAPKTYKGIVLAIASQLYKQLNLNHPLICADRDLGKQYEIVKTKDGAFKLSLPISLLVELSKERAAQKDKTPVNQLTDEQIKNAIEYLNGPNKTTLGIQDLTDDSHVLTITPIKNDQGNYQLKIKSHYVRLGRSHSIEANITTVVMPAKKIKEFADKYLREKKK